MHLLTRLNAFLDGAHTTAPGIAGSGLCLSSPLFCCILVTFFQSPYTIGKFVFAPK